MLPLAILAGGFATRLGSLTKDFPKCLIEINGRPFIDWQLDLLQENGFTDFVFCLSYKSELVQEHLGDGKKIGVRIQYSLDGKEQLGTGGAVQKALPLLGDQFGVLYGDSYLPIDYLSVEKAFLNSNGLGMMTVFQNKNQFDLSNVEFENGNLINYEKGINDPKMHHIDYGLTYFRAAALEFRPKDQSFDLSVLCHELARQKELVGFEVFNRFYEIGSLQGIDELSAHLREVSQ